MHLGLIAVIVAILCGGALLAVANYEANRPVMVASTVSLQYSDPTHWQVTSGGPHMANVGVTLNWSAHPSASGGYLAVEEGGIVVFSKSLDAGAGTFESTGGPLTLSISGLSDPSVVVSVSISWTAAPGWSAPL